MSQFRTLNIRNDYTVRDTVSFSNYLRDVRKYDLLTPEEEEELGARILEGDEAAVDELVQHNLRFVITVAKHYQGRGFGLEDLVAEGNVGLMEAARQFDYRKSRFVTFALIYVKSAIISFLQSKGNVVHLPSRMTRARHRAKVLLSKMEQEQGRSLTANDIIEDDSEIAGLRDALLYDMPVVSLDETICFEDDGVSRVSMLSDPEASECVRWMDQEECEMQVDRLMSELTPKNRKVMEMLYGIGCMRPYSYDEVANEMDLSLERIRQIKRQSIMMMRNGSMIDGMVC